jgi:hypothetical protein
VAGVTGTPAGSVLPATDASTGSAGPSRGTWQLILLALAGVLAAVYLLTSDESKVRRRKR